MVKEITKEQAEQWLDNMCQAYELASQHLEFGEYDEDTGDYDYDIFQYGMWERSIQIGSEALFKLAEILEVYVSTLRRDDNEPGFEYRYSFQYKNFVVFALGGPRNE